MANPAVVIGKPSGNTCESITDMPVTPPIMKLLGIRNTYSPTVTMRVPTVSMKYSLSTVLNLLSSCMMVFLTIAGYPL